MLELLSALTVDDAKVLVAVILKLSAMAWGVGLIVRLILNR